MTDTQALIARLEAATANHWWAQYLAAFVAALLVMVVLATFGASAYLTGWFSASGYFLTLDRFAALRAKGDA